MTDMFVVKRAPFGVGFVTGNSYWLCAWRLSREQFFRNDSQKGAGIGSSNYYADNLSNVYFSVC